MSLDRFLWPGSLTVAQMKKVDLLGRAGIGYSFTVSMVGMSSHWMQTSEGSVGEMSS